MKIRNITFPIIFSFFFGISCSNPDVQENKLLPKIKMHTNFGDIIIEIETRKAPKTAANFLKYVDENRYKNASFYRVVTLDNQPNDSIKIQVIQGGIGFIESSLRLEPIEHETTKETGITHKNGVISMARNKPGTASSEIFICIDDQPDLDFGGRRNQDGQGFAAFGRVIKGMQVVTRIHNEAADGQMLLSPIEITDIVRLLQLH